MTTRITAHPGADGTPENSLVSIVYGLSLPVDALAVDVCRRPGVPGYAPASLTDLFLPWEAVRQTVSSLSDLVLYRKPQPVAVWGQSGMGWGLAGTGREGQRNQGRTGEALSGAEASDAGEDVSEPRDAVTDPRADGMDIGEAAGEPDKPVTLREVLDRMAPHPPVKLLCRLLGHGLEEAACALALECGMAGRLILSGSTDPVLCGKSPLVRRIAEVYLDTEFHIPSFYRGFREIPDYDAQAARRMLNLCYQAGARTVHIRQDMVTRRFLERLKERRVGVSAWTVDDPEDMRWFLAAGAADISTRNLTSALALRG